VEKRTRAESLTVEAERELKQVALDLGCSLLAIANGLKACRELRESLAQDNDRGIDQSYADLQDALYELKEKSASTTVKTKMMTCLALSVAFSLGNAIRKCLGGIAKRMAERLVPTRRRFKPKASHQDDWDDEDNDWL